MISNWLLVAHPFLCAQSMSKRAGDASTKEKSETGSHRGRNTSEPIGHPHSQARNFPTRWAATCHDVCLDVQYEDSLHRQSWRCRNVRWREESGVLEASRAHVCASNTMVGPRTRACASIGESIYQGYQNCVSHFEEKQRGTMHMCIGVWLEIGCAGCKGGWVQSHLVTSGCPGFLSAIFFLEVKK